MCTTETMKRAFNISILAVLLPLCARSSEAQIASPHVAVKTVVAMDYPWFARMAVLEGTVELKATILPAGTVEKVRIISGPSPLAQPTKETLSKWLFTGCTTPTCEIRVVVSFTLSGSCYASENCPVQFEADLPGIVRVKAKRIHAIAN